MNRFGQLPFFRLAGVFSGLLFALVAFTACNDDDEDGATISEVVAVDENGRPVALATIRMECVSTINRPCNLEIEGLTDGNGVFTYQFELPKVLRIEASKVVRDTIVTGVPPQQVITRDSICGNSFISIVEGQTSRQTVVLYECN